MDCARLAAFAALRGALILIALASIAGAQNLTWVRQFGTDDHDMLPAAAPDGAGGVYVSGSTRGSLGGPHAGGQWDAWLAHYDSAGNQTWIRQFGTTAADFLWAAAPDGAGGVYVSGLTEGSLGGPNVGASDAWLAHYDSAGNQTWIRQFGTTDGERAIAAASDGAGGVYVGGLTGGSLGGPFAGGFTDAWLAHYDGAGNQTWIRQFGTTDGERVFAAAPDGAGGVYLGGDTTGSLGGPNAGDNDVWLAHYGSAGNQTWIRQFGTVDRDDLYAAAPDGSGGVYACGSTDGSFGALTVGGSDVWLAHYDSSGNQTWIRQFGTVDYDGLFDAAPDGAGGVYVDGLTEGSLGGPNAGDSDAWLAHYDGAGNQTWIRQFGTTERDPAEAAAPDGAGGVYVAGRTRGSLGGPNAGSNDAWIAHFDPFFATRFCTPAIPNSTGQAGVLTAVGSNPVVDNDLTVEATQLSLDSFGFFLTSMTQFVTVNPGGSQGNLCLGGSIGSFSGPGQVLNTGSTGTFSLALDLNAWPTLLPVVQPGDTWNFQAWYRDANPTPTSNFTDAVAVTLR